ncbi:MAG: acetate kinase [Mucilaginibacter sp.]|uniref:acetate/propionate family kinase n=1 Tax=Mucilaginibacter sp. TaxID=1882438 RepID=UPI003267115A
MNILIINFGSSSIKYQLFKMPAISPVCSGLIERIGSPDARVIHKVLQDNLVYTGTEDLPVKDHEAGLLKIVALLTDRFTGVIKNIDEIEVVGHRVVQGGRNLSATTVITEFVKAEIKRLFPLAPLHNPGHYQGIEVSEKIFSDAVQIAVFDTAFHQTMPQKAFRYAIPNALYTEHGLRVYGFHGTSHKYVAEQALKHLGNPDAKMITIHLGNGCSMAAVKGGKCIDTSMGLTPLDGLIMGTRCGSIDASVVTYLSSHLGYTTAQIDTLLNKQSGMLGLTGCSDMRDIGRLVDDGDENAVLAYDMYAYRIQKFIGSYAAALNGLDAIVFTAGVGENDTRTRDLVCTGMEYFGIRLDPEKNGLRTDGIRDIGLERSKTRILVIPTNEELEIATQCMELLTAAENKGEASLLQMTAVI